jgi:hypothetical protein
MAIHDHKLYGWNAEASFGISQDIAVGILYEMAIMGGGTLEIEF